MNSKVETFDLFPSKLFSMYLHDDVADFFGTLVENEDFRTVGENPHWVSRFNLLDDYPEMKKVFTDLVFHTLGDIENVKKIKITTSWFTATEPNTTPTLHRHQNSWYSGVYYFQDSYSGILFKNPIERDITTYGETTTNWRLIPEKNQLIIFPSYLHHKIEKNISDTVRHSLAFNIMPDGLTGAVDSEFEY